MERIETEKLTITGKKEESVTGKSRRLSEREEERERLKRCACNRKKKKEKV